MIQSVVQEVVAVSERNTPHLMAMVFVLDYK